MSDLTLRYASSDEDVVAIHGFLCVVALPNLVAPIDPAKSATEVWRVVNHECALMAMRGNVLVGTLGILQADWWWGKGQFFVNRWFFTLPGTNAGSMLLREGIRIAKDADLELHIIDEKKQRYRIFNRNPKRDAAPPVFLTPREPTHASPPSLQ
jgi:hypothetical protein